jgi:uncharacterized membrane protein
VNFIEIAYPGSTQTQAFGINNNGDIVGLYWPSQGGPIAGFLLSNGTYTTLLAPGSTYTQLTAINNMGGIVGSALGRHESWGFRYGHGVFKPIQVRRALSTYVQGLNDNGMIVGRFVNYPPARCFAFLKSGEFRSIMFPGARNTSCWGINNAGQIVGDYDLPVGGVGHGFLITPGN